MCGVLSIKVDGDYEALSTHNSVMDQVSQLLNEHPDQADFFDPVYVLLHMPAVPPPQPIAQAIAAWPPAPQGAAPAYRGVQAVGGSPVMYGFAGPLADAKQEASAFIGWMLQAGVTKAHMFLTRDVPQCFP